MTASIRRSGDANEQKVKQKCEFAPRRRKRVVPTHTFRNAKKESKHLPPQSKRKQTKSNFWARARDTAEQRKVYHCLVHTCPLRQEQKQSAKNVGWDRPVIFNSPFSAATFAYTYVFLAAAAATAQFPRKVQRAVLILKPNTIQSTWKVSLSREREREIRREKEVEVNSVTADWLTQW